MPIVPHGLELPAGTLLAVWRVDESEAFFKSAMAWDDGDLEGFERIHNHRRLESMAARLALHQLTGAELPWEMVKDAQNKPNFINQPAYHCALSHSHGVAAALLSDKPCGVDLQRYTEKMDMLAPKFVNDAEQKLLSNYPLHEQTNLFHQLWTAKESMYKVYGRKSLDFRTNLLVHGLERKSFGSIEKLNVQISCGLYYHWIDLAALGSYAVCVAIESKDLVKD